MKTGAFFLAAILGCVSVGNGVLFAQDAMRPIRVESPQEGITIKVYKEEPSDIPGHMVVIRDVIYAPAGKRNQVVTMEMPMFCTLLQGELTNDVTGQKRVKGESWTCRKGDKAQNHNRGSEEVIMREHILMPAGMKH
jgi:hypothetical protein